MSRYTCVYITHFPVWVVSCLNPALKRQELIVQRAGRVVASTAAPRRAGVEAGWTLERARAQAPRAIVQSAPDGSETQLAWEALLAEVYAHTPWLESLSPGWAVTRLDSRLAERVAEEWDVPMGVADDRATALLAALSTPPGSVQEIPPGQGEEFRAGLPVALLRHAGVSEATLERLIWLGFSTVGSVGRLNARQLAAQFPEGGLLEDLVLGRGDRPISLYRPPPTIEVEYEAAWPMEEPGEWEAALKHLLECAVARLDGRTVRRVTVQAKGSHQGPFTMGRGRRLLHKATGRAGRLWTPCRLACAEAVRGRHPIVSLTLELGGLVQPQAVQETLWDTRSDIERAVEAMEVRFPGRLLRIRVDEQATTPEEGFHLVPAAAAPTSAEERASPSKRKLAAGRRLARQPGMRLPARWEAPLGRTVSGEELPLLQGAGP